MRQFLLPQMQLLLVSGWQWVANSSQPTPQRNSEGCHAFKTFIGGEAADIA